MGFCDIVERICGHSAYVGPVHPDIFDFVPHIRCKGKRKIITVINLSGHCRKG